MELKQIFGCLFRPFNTLLIVLNGIETSLVRCSIISLRLLIVLNGIETLSV